MTISSSDRQRTAEPGTASDLTGLSFDELLAQLEAVVQRLESDELTLDASIETFERGVRLAARCQQLLSDAELRITEISGEIGETEPYLPDNEEES